MKLLLLSAVFFCLGNRLAAQFTRDQRIADSVIGWWDNNRFDKSLKPTTDALQLRRVAQVNKMVEWIKQSYEPVGGLGTFRRENLKVKYGVTLMIWNVSYDPMWLDEKKHFKPVAEEQTTAGFHMNVIPASYPVPFLNGNGDYFFTWPPDLFTKKNVEPGRMAGADPKISPQAYKYLTRTNETQMVMLAPGNKLPFVQLTRAEYLDLSEAAVIKTGGSDAERYLSTIRKLKTKYIGTLEQPAVIRYMQPTLNDFNGNMDVFDNGPADQDGPAYPVYRLPADVLKKAQNDKPQWIVIWFPHLTAEDGSRKYEMYRAMTENLNYDYIYNYFFEPEKVKGIPYTPNNQAAWQARLTAYRSMYTTGPKVSKPAGKKAANVLINEDFKNAAEGTMPAGWYKRSDGKPSGVTSISGQPGKWLKLGTTSAVFPQDIPKPLPANFMLEFDVATDPDFSGHTGGTVRLRLSTAALAPNDDELLPPDRQSIELTIIAGNDVNLKAGSNFRGQIRADINNTNGENKENYKEGIFFTKPLVEFTDKKSLVHIGLQLKNGECRIFINNKLFTTSHEFKLAYGKPCIQCGVSAVTRFNTISFKNIVGDSGDIGAYIGNVKLVKE